MSELWTGGCQCGAVRYRFSSRPRSAHVCHCRMCQKAFGGFYAPLAGAPKSDFEFTRGTVKIFKSSDISERGFCAECGTPLTFIDVDGDWVCVSIGSLDTPEYFPPQSQHGVESRYYFVDGIGHLPDHLPTETRKPELTAEIKATNHQHPDHDTDVWPQPKEAK